ncbi:phage protein [Escherichia phage L27]|uniref:Phage protein n=1 Tax=Escherichia phage L27 TaxID=2562890 RepID=A0A455XBS1_9CAUD|nr:phage protein [Escherichia phage L27]
MKHSKAFEKVFGDSLKATAGKPAKYYEEKRVRAGKTARKAASKDKHNFQ